tara:strand:- start:946 stop:1383 length:438 start_codon:yes stop_codon:yes gene_type:complete
MSTTNVVCTSCLAKNRIPSDRLKEGPKCGKCKKPLFAGKSFELTGANSGALLGNTDLPVLVDCWAAWCGPCKSFRPIFESAARKHEPHLLFAKLNTETNQQLGSKWGIRSIPTLILFKGGKEKARVSGALMLPQLEQWLAQQGVL